MKPFQLSTFFERTSSLWWYYFYMGFLYYFRDCPTCKNYNRSLVKSCSLQADVPIDEHYILALPDIWGEDVKILSARGAKEPFLYNTETQAILNVNYEEEGMEERVKNFLAGKELTDTE